MDTICSPHVNQVYVTKLYNLCMTVLLVEIKVWNCQIMRGSTKKKGNDGHKKNFIQLSNKRLYLQLMKIIFAGLPV